MPSPLNKFTPDKQYADGFTLIEIVMVLVLLGILSAVAVPKYFDLQDESNAKICRYNRGVVLESLLREAAIAKLGSDSGSRFSGAEDGQTVSEAIVAELGGKDCKYGQPCEKHCPGGVDAKGERGVFSVTYTRPKNDSGIGSFTIECSVHGVIYSGDSAAGIGNSGVSRASLEEWLIANYYTELDDIFTVRKGGTAEEAIIDSEGNADGSIAAKIADLLDGAGFDLKNNVISIKRTDQGFFNGDNKCTGSGCDRAGNHWRSTLYILVAERPTSDNPNPTVTQYSMQLDFKPKTGDYNDHSDEEVDRFGSLKATSEGDQYHVTQTPDGSYIIRKK